MPTAKSGHDFLQVNIDFGLDVSGSSPPSNGYGYLSDGGRELRRAVFRDVSLPDALVSDSDPPAKRLTLEYG